MTTLREDAMALRGTRVRAEFPDVSVVAVLRYLTPAGNLVFAGPSGFDLTHPFDDLRAIEDARIPCPSCGDRVNLVFPGRDDPTLLCVDCSRKRARDLPPPSTPCEDCGKADAFRSPKTNVFRCTACHVRADTLSGLGAERRVLEQLEKTDPVLGAACRGADVNDMRHDWKRLRKSRWRCRACQVDSYQEPAAYTAAQVEQDA